MRNKPLDAMRGIMVISVTFFHWLVFWRPPFSSPDLLHLSAIYPGVLAAGSAGVIVFFIISGYVISMTLGRCAGPGEFLYKRFSRLFPALFVCATLTYVVSITIKDEGYIPSLRDYIFSLTLHPEKFHATFVDGAYWTLAVEMRFYLWIALFFFLLKDRFWLGVVGLGVLSLAQTVVPMNFTAYYLIGKFVEYFLFGMALWYFSDGANRRAAVICLALSLILFVAHAFGSTDVPYEWTRLTYVVIGSTILALITLTGTTENWKIDPLPLLGRYSYSLYLVHQQIGVFIIGWLKRFTSASDFSALAAASIVCLTLAILVFHFVEIPAQDVMRREWIRWRRKPAVPT